MKYHFRAALIITASILLASASAAAQTFGDGVAAYSLQQYERAHAIWLRLAEEGDGQAQFRLAVLYDLGFGVEANEAEAAKWYRRAAEGGEADAQLALAFSLRDGRGVREDKVEAVQWFRRVARKGYPRAQFELASHYLLGEGVEKDPREAYRWFEMAYTNYPDGPERRRAAQVMQQLAVILGIGQ